MNQGCWSEVWFGTRSRMILRPLPCAPRHQRVEILHRAEQRIDAGIIGDVVAEIGHRRGKDRRQPDRVDAERLQIGQPLDDAGDVADAVGIGILKRARIDLIENAVPPPGYCRPDPSWQSPLAYRAARANAGTAARFKSMNCPEMTARRHGRAFSPNFRLAGRQKSALCGNDPANRNRNQGEGRRRHHSGDAVRAELHPDLVRGQQEGRRDRSRRRRCRRFGARSSNPTSRSRRSG